VTGEYTPQACLGSLTYLKTAVQNCSLELEFVCAGEHGNVSVLFAPTSFLAKSHRSWRAGSSCNQSETQQLKEHMLRIRNWYSGAILSYAVGPGESCCHLV